MAHTHFIEAQKFLGRKVLDGKSSVLSVMQSLGLTVVKQNSVVSVVRDFNSREVKQCREGSQRLHFNSSEVKQCSEYSQRFILIVAK